MTTLLLKLPWFASAPAVVIVAAVIGWLGYTYTGDYFVQTCVNEVNLLTGEAEASDCGEAPAAAATADGDGSAPGGAATPVAARPGAETADERSADDTMDDDGGEGDAMDGEEPAGDAMDGDDDGPGVLAAGTFRDGDPGHNGEGIAQLQRLADGSLNLFLQDFSVTNGPDLFVVLSKDPDGYSGDEPIVLERLQANNGNQNYAIPGDIDLSEYRSVVIWCRQFNVDFAIATLEVQ